MRRYLHQAVCLFRGRALVLAAVIVWLATAGLNARADDPSLRAWLGGSSLRDNAWTELDGNVVNSGDTDVAALLVVNTKGDAEVQFSAPAWIPAHAQEKVAVPFFARDLNPRIQSSGLDVKLIDISGSGDHVLAQDVTLATHQTSDCPTGVCADESDDEVSALVSRLRLSADRKTWTRLFTARTLPPSVIGLLGMSELVIGTRTPLSVAQALAVRQWVLQGGHLWILADRVDADSARLMLGDDWTCEPAGWTELPTVVFAGDDVINEMSRREPQKPAEFADPVRMIRLLAPGMQVTQTIGGWPALMWKPVGRGLLLVTTLEPRAIGQKAGSDYPYWFSQTALRFLVPLASAEPLAGRARQTTLAMNTLAQSMVEHKVARRGPVLLVLVLMAGLLLALGWRFAAQRHLEWIAPAAVVLSILATGAMAMLGALSRGSTPLTLAGMNRAHVISGGHQLAYRGANDIYSPGGFDGTLLAAPGNWVMPDLSTQKGHVVRLVAGELEPMRWEHLHFPAAASLPATAAGFTSLPAPLFAEGTFDAQGFIGELHGITGAGEMETVISAPGGRLAPRFTSGGHFIAGVSDELTPGEMTRETVTADRAHRLAAMKPWAESNSDAGVVLYTWTDVPFTGISLAASRPQPPQHRILTLVSMPVTIERPAEGVDFTVPAPFLTLSAVRIAGITAGAPIFDERGGQFLGRMSIPNRAIVRFTLPREILPVQNVASRLTVNIDAADRDVTIFSVHRDDAGKMIRHDLQHLHGPIEPMALDLAGTADLQPDERGGVMIGMDVGPGRDAFSSWSLSGMSLSVKARCVGARLRDPVVAVPAPAGLEASPQDFMPRAPQGPANRFVRGRQPRKPAAPASSPRPRRAPLHKDAR